MTEFAGEVRGHGNVDGLVQLWRLDRRLVRGGLAALLALILIPLFRRTIRIEWSESLHRHVAVSWLLLAIVLWLFLTPSAFGLLLVIVAVIHAVTQYHPAKPVV